MALFDIILNIAANTASLEAGMRRAESAVTSFANNVKRLAEAAAVAELAHFTEQMISAGAAMQHAVDISGANAAEFQRLAYAANTVGVSAESLATSMLRMGRNLSEAKTGAKTQTEALEALGLSFRELKNLDPVDQFVLLGQQLSALKSPMDQDRAAIALFGKGVAELLPLFKLTREELNALMGRAPILSDEQLHNLHEGEKALKELTATLKYLGEVLASFTAGPLSQFAKQMNDIATGRKSWTDALLDAAKAVSGVKPDASLAKFDAERQAALEKARAAPPPAAAPSLPEITVTARPPPGYQEAVLSQVAVTARRLPGGGFPGEAEEKAAKELYDTFTKINEERRKGDLTEEEFNSRLDEALDKFHDIHDRVQMINVDLKHMVEPLSELQVAMHNVVEGIQEGLARAFHEQGALGKNILKEILAALEDRAIYAAIAEIGDAMKAALAPSAAGGGSGIFSGISGAVMAAVFGYGGAPVGGGGVSGSDLSGYSEGISEALGIGGASAKHAGRGVAINYNIDARGADADRIMTMMPGLLTQASEKSKRDILSAFQRSGLPAPRSA